MNLINLKRKEAMFQRIISEIITEELKNTEISDPTVTAVKLAKDSGYLLVFVTFSARPEISLAALKRAKGYIKNRLAKLTNLRKVPQLNFKIDDSLERAAKIEKILDDLKKNK